VKKLPGIALLLVALFIAACGSTPSPAATTTLPPAAPTQAAPTAAPTNTMFVSPLETTMASPLNMPNPASQYCVDQGYKLEIRDEAGGQVGYCIFADGAECEEWAFYRGECTAP
jgi:putative hemolysin